jgi:uncharacterized BrkB/YihY/UPF0761 family membrane protein
MASEPSKREIARGWKRRLLEVVVVVGLMFVSWWIAGLVVPVPQGTSTREAAEAAQKSVKRVWWWTGLLIYVVLCVVVFHLAPLAWRWWYAHRQPHERGL